MERLGIILMGSNSSGKTTAVQTVVDHFNNPGLVAIRADNDGRFKRGREEKTAAILEVFLSDTPVVICEGATAHNYQAFLDARAQARHHREMHVFLTVQDPPAMKAHLKERCARTGKKFREDYWDHTKLMYEGQKRGRNACRKFGVHPNIFRIEEDFTGVSLMTQSMIELIEKVL